MQANQSLKHKVLFIFGIALFNEMWRVGQRLADVRALSGNSPRTLLEVVLRKRVTIKASGDKSPQLDSAE